MRNGALLILCVSVCDAFAPPRAFGARSALEAARGRSGGPCVMSGGKPKVVVTGLGTFTSLGHDAQSFFDALLEGKCGIGPVTRFEAATAAAKIASEVHDFDVTQYWEKK